MKFDDKNPKSIYPSIGDCPGQFKYCPEQIGSFPKSLQERIETLEIQVLKLQQVVSVLLKVNRDLKLNNLDEIRKIINES